VLLALTEVKDLPALQQRESHHVEAPATPHFSPANRFRGDFWTILFGVRHDLLHSLSVMEFSPPRVPEMSGSLNSNAMRWSTVKPPNRKGMFLLECD
jgi:hypothetical protein